MRIINNLAMLSVATLLAGCGTNYNNDYLMAKQTQSTKTPAHLSDYARQTLYPVPDGAVWHSNEPVSIYPPGSALADKGNKHPTAAIVSLGIDAQGSSALEVTKPYNDVWQQLPKNLQTAGFTVLHNDPDIGLYVASKAKTNYQFTVMSATQGDSVISVRDGQGGFVERHREQSNYDVTRNTTTENVAMMNKEPLYTGKAKSVYATDNPNEFILEFRDDTSRFDGEKIEKLARKGMVNNYFNAFIMQHLEKAGIKTHFIKLLSHTTSLVKRLEMIPVESVVRNRTAGGLCRRLGIEEGIILKEQIFEFFLKNDKLHDPMVNDSVILAFEWATETEISCMKTLSFEVNQILEPLFDQAGLILVDYKLEFGRSGDEIILGDEFTPDGCRVWDKETLEKLDKDRFRRDLGSVVESYEIIAQRLGIKIPESI